MSARNRFLRLGAVAALTTATLAHAGGPLLIADPERRIPYAYPNGVPVRVYTDLGPLGVLSNKTADALTAFAFGQWTQVPSSDFTATVAGDFALLGLPDIDGTNAAQVVGTFNGGGIHVLYDHDGSIIRDFFGAPDGVLGIASPEWSDGTTITESWAVMNGAAVDPSDATGTGFAAVFTHEFGHSINLAHSQTNGAIAFYGDAEGPTGCTPPYSAPLTVDDIETMYPFISPEQTGAAQSTVEHPDDLASLSNLYPAAGWPGSRGTLRGRILLTDGSTPLTGINVIARNVANPYGDSVSALSGDYSQGQSTTPDGSYTLNGLTPGARYVVYVDGIVQGGFSTPPSPLPGGEEFYNGAGESGHSETDDRCAYTELAAAAGAPITADILFNVAEADENFFAIPVASIQPSGVSGNGKVIVGGFVGQDAPGWRWSEKDGFTVLGGNGNVKVDKSGRIISGSFTGPDGLIRTGIWTGGQSWKALPVRKGAVGSCDAVETSPFDLSGNGDAVVGLAYGPGGCGSPFAFRWTAERGLEDLGGLGPWTRANATNEDGRVVVGWNDLHPEYSGRIGVYWKHGQQHLMDPDVLVGEAGDVSADGSVIVGQGAENGSAWRWDERTGLESLGKLPVPGLPDFFNRASATVVSDDGSVILGFSGFFTQREPFLWTRELGMVNFGDFLIDQGMLAVEQWDLGTPMAMSANGRRITGWGFGPLGVQGWAVTLDKVAVCVNPHGPKPKTKEVRFPHGMNEQLARGAIPGRCERVLE
ncbi:hypothetical protein JRI60_16260 [Archangium violaceum]|uniref:hypothetical protein n=1 Tax=Archangium violaceum TaxID=83451 RepID=UPI00194E4BA6|nr:hypothetical protein [Archangium violaceum]QRO00470.1 hypothetical protein JRI60_16260 [Archangium violaceum]